MSNPFFLDAEGSQEIGTLHDGGKINQLCEKKVEGIRKGYDEIAQQLLEDNFILTALELHTELQEIGKELPRLCDYFSNPGNFERAKPPEIHSTSPPVSLQRSGSIQTFDSLDWARYSDDGDRQVEDRIAGLEFELRKASDTIKSLRKALTVATEEASATPVDDRAYVNQERDCADVIKPHEKRALNFLVNEYLLHHDYKLTSVTFSEENENQDFENWDDVGLNVAKPPNLLNLYQDYGHHVAPQVITADCETNVNFYQAEIEILLQENDEKTSELRKQQEEISTVTLALQNIRTEVNDLEAKLRETEESLAEAQQIKLCAQHSHNSEALSTYDSEHQEMASGSFTEQAERQNWGYQPVDREIPQQFMNMLIALTFHVPEQNRIAHEVSKLDGNSSESLVNMLACCIPNIVPNVLLTKREELLPLILCAANLHTDVKSRDNMLNILFNLIKKPDAEQRQMILTGCVMFAQCNGPQRVEEELLPQCWEQINDKHQERRLLVAEACGSLIPYMSNEMRSSLVFSMLQQMIMDEKVEEVRAAVIRSLGVLTSFMHDEDKYYMVLSLYTRLLRDTSEPVQTEIVSVLLPSLALWSVQLNRLADLTEIVFNALDGSLTEPNEDNEIYIVDDTFLIAIRHLKTLINFQYLAMIMNVPYATQQMPSNGAIINDTAFISICNAGATTLSQIDNLVSDMDSFTSHIQTFQQQTSEEWYKTWEEFELLVHTTFSKLTMLLMSIQAKDCKVLAKIISYINQLCYVVGQKVTFDKIEPKLCDLLKLGDVVAAAQHLKMYTSCLLPLLICGVIGSFHDKESIAKLCGYLKQSITVVSTSEVPLYAIEATVTHLLREEDFVEPVLDMLWELVMHTVPAVRANASFLFQLCATCLESRSEISTKVLPALVTLARDTEIGVRISTVEPFGAILSSSSNREILDKVYMEFISLMDEPSNFYDNALQLGLIRTFSQIGPNAEPSFRDDVIIPRLNTWASANNSCGDTIRRRDVALKLLEAYSALSCCFINEQIMKEMFLPGLQCLYTDMKDLALDGAEVVQSMIRDLETKHSVSSVTEAMVNVGAYLGQALPKGNHKQVMLSKFKDLKEKSAPTKMTSLFTKKK